MEEICSTNKHKRCTVKTISHRKTNNKKVVPNGKFDIRHAHLSNLIFGTILIDCMKNCFKTINGEKYLAQININVERYYTGSQKTRNKKVVPNGKFDIWYFVPFFSFFLSVFFAVSS